MNGEFQELYNELDKRLTIFEAVNMEWRKNHDERAVESRKDIHFIKNYITGLPCKSNAEKWNGLSASMNRLWAGFWAVIVIGLVLGLWVKSVMGG